MLGRRGVCSPLVSANPPVMLSMLPLARGAHWRPTLNVLGIRRCFAFLAVTIAAFASMASSCAVQEGIAVVGRTPDGTLGANASPHLGGPYLSQDGGYTWTKADGEYVLLLRQKWQESSNETLSGPNYYLEGPHVIQADSRDGSDEIVYSFGYLQRGGNRWMQALDKRGIEYRVTTTEPLDLHYDHRSGNLIVAMGLQGVVVVEPDGRSFKVALGPYSPTDFSLGSKVRALLASLVHGWPAASTGVAFLLAFSFANLALTLPIVRAERRFIIVWAAAISACLAVLFGVYPQVLQHPQDAGIRMLAWLSFGLTGFGLIPILLAATGLVSARASFIHLLAVIAVGIGMLLPLGVGALVLFEMGAIIANFVAVGLVGMASFSLWMFRKRAHAFAGMKIGIGGWRHRGRGTPPS